MKKVFLTIGIMFFVSSLSFASVWSKNGKLKYVSGNQETGGNAYYKCPEPDTKLCMSGDGNQLILWGRDDDWNAVIYKITTLAQSDGIVDDITGDIIDPNDIEDHLDNFENLLFHVIIN